MMGQLKQVSDDQLQEIIFAKNDKGRDNAFWSEISMPQTSFFRK
jgi:hypothetical protein